MKKVWKILRIVGLVVVGGIVTLWTVGMIQNRAEIREMLKEGK